MNTVNVVVKKGRERVEGEKYKEKAEGDHGYVVEIVWCLQSYLKHKA